MHVIVNGKTVKSCTMFAVQADGADVMTVEAWLKMERSIHCRKVQGRTRLQCGFCTPGMLMSTYALLQKNPQPSEDEIAGGYPATCAAAPDIKTS